jgi:outer membrane protein assembly factor BamB
VKSKPLVNKAYNQVWVSSYNGCLHRIDIATGNSIECIELRSCCLNPHTILGGSIEVQESFSVYANGIQSFDGERILFVTTKGLMVAVNTKSGLNSSSTQLVETCEFAIQLGFPVFSTPLLLSSEASKIDIIICSVEGAVRRVKFELKSYESSLWTTEILWTLKVSRPIFSSPSLLPQASSVVVGCHDGVLRCIGVEDGSVRWEIDLGSIIFSSPLIVPLSNDIGVMIVTATTAGSIHLMELVTEDSYPSMVSSIKLPAEIYSSPMQHLGRAGAIIVGSRGDEVVKISLGSIL